MRRDFKTVLCTGMLAAVCGPAGAQYFKNRILTSKHNFAASGTAAIHASTEQQVCVFCHAPHNASPQVPLWNHRQPAVAAYGLYSSTTLRSTVTQPGAADSSKLCLSCHDGTVALGDTMNDGLLAFQDGAGVQNPNYMLPPGSASNLHKGTGFGDDHPFAFTPMTGTEVMNPPANDRVRLDGSGKVQCVTCHDPHVEDLDPTARKFLVKVNAASALCLTCHTKAGWNTSSHKQPANGTNNARYTSVQGAHTGYTGVSQNGCESCHRPHTPAVGQRLVKFIGANTCYQCHNGTVAATSLNIQTEFAKPYKHPVLTTASVHDASEGPASAVRLPEISSTAARHAECPDCHNGHAANPATAPAPAVSGALSRVWGIQTGGGQANPAANQYEICYKCHADSANKPYVVNAGTDTLGFGRLPIRQFDTGVDRYNKRVEFNSVVAYHPVAKARNLVVTTDVRSLRTYMITPGGTNILTRPLNAGTIIYCTDCHNNDTGWNLDPAATPKNGAAGPHGSNIVHLLERSYMYNTPPGTPGNSMTLTQIQTGAAAAAANRLCDKCHNVAASVWSNQSFRYHHLHIQLGAACSTCHASHGIVTGSGAAMLVNFDTKIVAPSNGVLRYTRTGTRTGNCTLRCHSENHTNWGYWSF